MSALLKVLIMTAIIILSHVKLYAASLHSNIYSAKMNIRLTKPYRVLTNVERLKCLTECDKDFMCLSVNYHHGDKTCALTSFRHDDVIDDFIVWSVPENGWKLYYQQSKDSRFISGIQTWASSVAVSKSGNLVIDRRFLSNFFDNSCFHSEEEETNFLIIELDRVTSVTHVDLLFRSDCCNHRNRYIEIIVSQTKADADVNKGDVCAYFNGPPIDPTIPVRVQCAANSLGKFVKFIQRNVNFTAFLPLHICEIAFYTNE